MTFTAIRSIGERLRRRFNLSFWCTLYNVLLFVMMVFSILVGAITVLAVNLLHGLVTGLTGRANARLEAWKSRRWPLDMRDWRDRRDGEGTHRV